MTPPDAYKAILQAWINTWHTLVGGTQASPAVTYAIDNRKMAQAATFAIVEIVNLGADQVTAGASGVRRYEHTGFVDVRLFGPRDQGRGALDTLAEHVRTIYESTRLGADGNDRGVVTYTLTVTELRGDPEYPDLWCLLCRTPFYFHARR